MSTKTAKSVVMVVKLVNGEDIIGEVEEIEGEQTVIVNGVLRVIESVKRGNIEVHLVRWNSCAEPLPVCIHRSKIVTVCEPTADFTNFYYDRLEEVYGQERQEPEPEFDKTHLPKGATIQEGSVVFETEADHENWVKLINSHPPSKAVH